MSWESTTTYYQLLNRLTKQRLGGLHSSNLLLYSFNFAEIEEMQARGDWQMATESMIAAARNLERGGAECIVICTNTMHKMASEIQIAVDLPLIHIADATASAIKRSNSKRPLLLATQYTMEQDFYKGKLLKDHQIKVEIPNQWQRRSVHNIIYQELCKGVITAEAKSTYIEVVEDNLAQGADGVILGCTEIGLLLSKSDFSIPVFDTTDLHARAALDFALS